MATKVLVYHWMLKEPPCEDAFRAPMSVKDDWFMYLDEVSDIEELAKSYDVMIKERDGQLIVILDEKGRTFRQR